MVPFDFLRPPRHLLALFVAATVLPALALGWLAWIGLAELDRQQARDALSSASIRVVADLRQHLDELSRQLPTLPHRSDLTLADDSVLVTVTGDGVVARPAGRLLYVPNAPRGPLVRSTTLETASLLERGGDYRAAAAEFDRVSASAREPSAQATALIGLGRTLRRDGRPREALAAYDSLAELGSHRVLDATAALVARRARAAVLAEIESPDLAAEAQALYDDLVGGTWQLDLPAFEFYLSEVQQWLPDVLPDGPMRDRRALSDAAIAVMALRNPGGGEPGYGTVSIRAGATPFVVVWQNTGPEFTALVAGPSWLDGPLATWAMDNLAVTLVDTDQQFAFGASEPLADPVVASAGDTGLPWSVQVAYADPDQMPWLLTSSRNSLLAGFLAAGLLLVGGGVLVARALSRELAVARLQSDFVAAVSHEFRSPLTSMKHLIEMLAQGAVPDDGRRQRYYDVLNGETDRLRQLVEDLLDFGRMEAGKASYQLEPLDVRAVVQQAADEFRRDADAGDRLVAAVEGPAVTVAADREALMRAIRNLLDNAAKYSPSSTPIHLEVLAETREVRVRVRDEGPGIPAREQKRIFTRFYRGTGVTRAGIKGTGLGLATVLHLVRAHRGRVQVESAPGAGSTFTIQLPIADEATT